MMNADDRRRALDSLDSQLQTKVLAVVKAAWTTAVSGAAKSVTDVWPDKLAASGTALQRAFAGYRPLVEAAVPVTPRDAAVKAITDAAAQYGSDLGATSSALVDAKNFKSDSEKTTIDGARDAVDQAGIALTSWVGDLQRFDASVVATPTPTPTPKPKPTPTPTNAQLHSFTTLVNGNPYPMTARATIASASDWASTTNRPDVAFANVTLDDFAQSRAQLDVAAGASSAKYTVEVTLQRDKPVVVSFTCDQRLVEDVQNYVPLPTQPENAGYVVFLATQPGALELALVVAEQEVG